MPTNIIIPGGDESRQAGGVLHLPEAIERNPERQLCIYNRVSSYKQAKKRKVDLTVKTTAVLQAVLAVAPDLPLPRTFQGVERGYVQDLRKVLRKAVDYALDNNCMIVASDLSRFVRATDYDSKSNRNAWPTTDDFDALRELTRGVLLATVESPMLSEFERHSSATKRTEKCGRPRSLPPRVAIKILEDLGYPYRGESGRLTWDMSLAQVAQKYGVTKASVQRLLDSPAPGFPDIRLKDVDDPMRRYRRAWEEEKREAERRAQGDGLF